jgi:hypothetical protein
MDPCEVSGGYTSVSAIQHEDRGGESGCKAKPARACAGFLDCNVWCREGESNPQGTKYRRILSPLRLPVPPSRRGRVFLLYGRWRDLNNHSTGKGFRTGDAIVGSLTRNSVPCPGLLSTMIAP